MAQARSALIGRTIVNPFVDYAFVGGAVTIPLFIALYFFPGLKPSDEAITLRAFILINGAHFAASSLRLYTKPGARQEFPILSWGFPVVCLIAVAAGLWSHRIGYSITTLYLTWSPYHYAAQTYGLAVMYAMQSGAKLDLREKWQMWWVCLLPFVFAFFTAPEGGFAWFVDRQWLMTVPVLATAYRGLIGVITIATFLLPVSLFWQLTRMRGKNVPLISLVLQVTNGIWWLGTTYMDAWWFTAMLHSIQYLIVVVDRHVADQMARTDVKANSPVHRPWVYGSLFYGISFILSLFIFFIVPLGYVGLGFGATQSFIMMTMVINLHHFIVDGFIWRSRPSKKPAVSLPSDRMPLAV